MTKVAGLLLMLFAGRAFGANTRPLPPTILEPSPGVLVSHADVHMVTLAMDDPDGDEHLCTTWEILRRFDVVWRAECVRGLPKVHAHLGDGLFLTHRSLDPLAKYTLRVRFRDDSGDPATEWSDWSNLEFSTAAASAIEAMLITQVDVSRRHDWLYESGDPVVLSGNSGRALRLLTNENDVLLEVGGEGSVESWITYPGSTHHHPIKLLLSAGSRTWVLGESAITFHDGDGTERSVFLPALEIPGHESVVLWISTNGSTHYGQLEDEEPDFTAIARLNPIPWTVSDSGFVVEPVAGGFQLPVDIAFRPDQQDSGPSFYVAELYGKIRAVAADGTVSLFASDLLNFDPQGDFPGAGEIGVGGIAVDPDSGDLFVSRLSRTFPGSSDFIPEVVRLRSFDGGWTVGSETLVLALNGEYQGPSHQISKLSFGPDGMLYVHMADGSCIPCARDIESYRGKILRLRPNGNVPADNPYYDDADGVTAKDAIFALGLRNPFGGAWRTRDGSLYVAENGPAVDRFARVIPGFDFGWSGFDFDMYRGAIYNWTEGAAAPVRVAVIEPETFGGSGFPSRFQDQVFVTESGATWISGPQKVGKKISRFLVTPAGGLGDDRRTFVEYNGPGKATAAALAAGPDGLYFSDLYADASLESPFASGAKVFRIRYAGSTGFRATEEAAAEGCRTFHFEALGSSGDGPFRWDSGDGQTFQGTGFSHTYAECGRYLVTVEDQSGRVPSRSIVIGSWKDEGGGLRRRDYAASGDLVAELDGVGAVVDSGGTAGVTRTVLEGRIQAIFGQIHTVEIETRGHVRMVIDGVVVLDEDVDGSASGKFRFEPGRRQQLRLEIDRDDAWSGLRLIWSSESQERRPIQRDKLFAPIERRKPSQRH